MKLLIIFLFPLVFSTNLGPELGSLEDYAGEKQEEHPRECYFIARKIVGEFRRRFAPLTAEQLDRSEAAIQDCVNKIAKINKKVDNVKDDLSDAIFKAFQFFEVHVLSCGSKLKSKKTWDDEESEECLKSTGMKPGDYFCNDEWGKDGCLIDIWKKECSEGEIAIGMKKFAPFLSKRQQECVDLYSHNFNM